MKLTAIGLSQAIRLVPDATAPNPRMHILDVVKGLECRYHFLQVPRTLPEYDATKGITFLQGTFSGFTIEKFQIYTNGVLVEGKERRTPDLDAFLEDSADWAAKEFGVELDRWRTAPRGYLSNIEIQSDAPLFDWFNQLSGLGDQITDVLHTYRQTPPRYRVSEFHMHADLTGIGLPHPTEFMLARRAGHPYSDNLYFSSAPLSTPDHLGILERLEKILTR